MMYLSWMSGAERETFFFFIWKVSMDIQAIYFMIDAVTRAQEDD